MCDFDALFIIGFFLGTAILSVLQLILLLSL